MGGALCSDLVAMTGEGQQSYLQGFQAGMNHAMMIGHAALDVGADGAMAAHGEGANVGNAVTNAGANADTPVTSGTDPEAENAAGEAPANVAPEAGGVPGGGNETAPSTTETGTETGAGANGATGTQATTNTPASNATGGAMPSEMVEFDAAAVISGCEASPETPIASFVGGSTAVTNP